MKTLLITLLLSISIFGQTGGSRKSVLSQAQKDSIIALMQDSLGYVLPSSFGAVGDGVTSDSAAFQNLFDADESNISLTPNSTYLLGYQQVNYYDTQGNYVFDGNGATIDLQGYYLTFTTRSTSWTSGYGSAFRQAALSAAVLEDTLFTTDFVKDSLWVGIEDIDDWTLQAGDMLFFSDSTTYSNSAFNGGVYVISTVDTGALRLYFTKPIPRKVEHAKGHSIRLVDCSGYNFIIKNLKVINGAINISGFENVLIQNVDMRMDSAQAAYTYDNQPAENAFAGSQLFWNRNVTVENCYVDGYLIPENGYGFSVGMGDEVRFDKLIGADCRHIITTSNATGYDDEGGVWLNTLKVTNSSFSFSNLAESMITANLTAVDTHHGVDWVYIDNCEIYGGDLVSKLRGINIKLSNVRTFNTIGVIDVSGNQIDTTENYNRKTIEMENSVFNNVGRVVYVLNGNTDAIASIKLINVKTTLLNSLGVIASASNTIIDTIIINGGEYRQINNPPTAYLFQTTATNDSIVDYMEMVNVFTSLTGILSAPKTPVTNTVISNSRFSDCDDWIKVTSTSSDFAYGKWLMKDSYFENITNVISSVSYRNNFTWDNCTFINCNSIAANSASEYLRDIVFNKCTFTNSAMGNFQDGDLTVSNSLINGSPVGARWIYTLNADSVFLLDNTIKIDISGTQGLISGGSPLIFNNNIVIIDSMTSNYLISFDGADYSEFIDNKFTIKSYGAKDVVRIADASDVVISGNFFKFSNNANHKAFDVDNSTISYGINTFMGVSAPLDTTGITATTLSTFGD